MFFDSLLHVKLDARYFTYKASLNLTTFLQGRYYIPILQRGVWGSEKLGNLSKSTQLLSGRAESNMTHCLSFTPVDLSQGQFCSQGMFDKVRRDL